MSMKGGLVATAMLMLALAACQKTGQDGDAFSGVGPRPDVLPVMLNKDLPFKYPPSLYAKKVQANVTLRVYIDKEGQIVPESTHVAVSYTHLRAHETPE